jgi:hypothetical protein
MIHNKYPTHLLSAFGNPRNTPQTVKTADQVEVIIKTS